MLSKHLFRKHKGISAVPVVVILMLVGVVVGILTYTVAMDVSWEAEMGANEAYHIITEDEIEGPAHGVEGAYGGGTITPGSPGGSGGSGGSGSGSSGGSEEPTDPNAPKTVTVTYSANGHSFNDGLGHNIMNYTITGTTIRESLGRYKEPVSETHVFEGWYDNPSGEGKAFVIPGDIKTTITLYAKWRPLPTAEFAIYSETDNSLRFYNRPGEPAEGETFNGLKVSAIYKGFTAESYTATKSAPWVAQAANIHEVYFVDSISAWDTSYWFAGLEKVQKMDMTNLDASQVKKMDGMFQNVGAAATEVEIKKLSAMNSVSATSMKDMFNGVGYMADKVILDVDGLKTQNVTDMSGMFGLFATYAQDATIKGLPTLKVEKVSNMNKMFESAGFSVKNFKIEVTGWQTNALETANNMFANAGAYSEDFVLAGIQGFKVDKLADATRMFRGLGMADEDFYIDLTNWNITNKLQYMNEMFSGYASASRTWTLGDISNWDTSSVKSMDATFEYAGYSKSDYIQLDLSGWSSEKLESAAAMFKDTRYLTEISFGDAWTWEDEEGLLLIPDPAYIQGADGKWYDIEKSKRFAPDTIPDSTVATYTAIPPIYTVTFYSVAGTFEKVEQIEPPPEPKSVPAPESKSYDKGEVNVVKFQGLNALSGEYKEPMHRFIGRGFAGWYKTPFDENEVSVNLDNVMEDMELYARYGNLRTIAIYSEDDNSLRFYKTAEEIEIGDKFNDLTVSNIYDQIEETFFWSDTLPGWFEDGLSEDVKIVTVENEISPISMYGWFAEMKNLEHMDLSLLDTSNVQSMTGTFYYVAANVATPVFIEPEWDTSHVYDTAYMFSHCNLPVVDISDWDMGNVEYSERMFEEVYMEELVIPESLYVIGDHFAYQGEKEPTLKEITFLHDVIRVPTSYLEISRDLFNKAPAARDGSVSFYKISDQTPVFTEEMDDTEYRIYYTEEDDYGATYYKSSTCALSYAGDIFVDDETGDAIIAWLWYGEIFVVYKETEISEGLVLEPGMYSLIFGNDYWKRYPYEIYFYDDEPFVDIYEPPIFFGKNCFYAGAPYSPDNYMPTILNAEYKDALYYDWLGDNRQRTITVTYKSMESVFADGTDTNVVKYITVPNDRLPLEKFALNQDMEEYFDEIYYSGTDVRYKYIEVDASAIKTYIYVDGEDMLDSDFDLILYRGDFASDFINGNTQPDSFIDPSYSGGKYYEYYIEGNGGDLVAIEANNEENTLYTLIISAPGYYYDEYYGSELIYSISYETQDDYYYLGEKDALDGPHLDMITAFENMKSVDDTVDMNIAYDFNQAGYCLEYNNPDVKAVKVTLKHINDKGFKYDPDIDLWGGIFIYDDDFDYCILDPENIGEEVIIPTNRFYIEAWGNIPHNDFEIEIEEAIPKAKLQIIEGEYKQPLDMEEEYLYFDAFYTEDGDLFNDEYMSGDITVYAQYYRPPIIRSWTEEEIYNAMPQPKSQDTQSYDYHSYGESIEKVLIVDSIKDIMDKLDITEKDFYDAAYEIWDVSAFGDGSVMAYRMPSRFLTALPEAPQPMALSLNNEIETYESYSAFDTLVIAGNGYGEIWTLENFDHIFANMVALEEIHGLDVFNTFNAKTMVGTFADCRSLTSISLNSFDTSDVTDISCILAGTHRLEYLDLSKVDFSNVNKNDYALAASGIYTLKLPVSLNYISDNFAPYCDYLTRIDFAHTKDDILTMKQGAFYVEDLLPTDIGGENDTVINYDWVTDNRKATPVELLPNYPMLNRYASNNSYYGSGGLVQDFHNPAYSGGVVRINIYDSEPIPLNPDAGPWDISDAKDGSIMAWATIIDDEIGEERPQYGGGEAYSLTRLASNGVSSVIPGSEEELEEAEKHWYEVTITGDGSGKIYTNPDSFVLFSDFYFLEEINGLELLDTRLTYNMGDMFSSNYALKSIEGVENWDVSNVYDMSRMFSSNYELQQILGVENWDVSNVYDMSRMFSSNYELQQISGIEKWNVSSLGNAYSMFDNNSKLTVDVSKWNTCNLYTASNMFSGVLALPNGNVSKWDVANLYNAPSMFAGCKEPEIDISEWTLENLYDGSYMFMGSGIRKGDLSSAIINETARLEYMFANSLIEELILPESMLLIPNAFAENCYNLTKIIFLHGATEEIALEDAYVAGYYNNFRVSEPYNEENLLKTTVVSQNSGVYRINWAELFNREVTNDYTIIFDANGGEFENSGDTNLLTGHYDTKTQQNEITSGSVLIPYKIVDGQKLFFSGWFLTPECNAEDTINIEDICADITLYARYGEGKTITHHAPANSTFSDGSTEKEIIYVKGDYKDAPVISKVYGADLKEARYTRTPYSPDGDIDLVTIPGADYLKVKMYYETASSQWVAAYLPTVAPTTENYNESITGLLQSNYERKCVEFTVPGDAVQFFYVSTTHNTTLGYYAEVTAYYEDEWRPYLNEKVEFPLFENYEYVAEEWYSTQDCLPTNKLDISEDIEDAYTIGVLKNYAHRFNANGGIFTHGNDVNALYYDKDKTTKDLTIISKLPNINEDGTSGTRYSYVNNILYADTVVIPGAESLKVNIKVGTEGSYDYLLFYGNGLDASYEKLYSTGTRTYSRTVNGDAVKFVFSSDSSGYGYYGYYATITPTNAQDLLVLSGKYEEPTHPNSEMAFGGWYTTPTCAPGSHITIDEINAMRETVEVYAKWYEKGNAFATYCAEDKTLRVYYNNDTLPVNGDVYDGVEVSQVYPNLKLDGYTDSNRPAWYLNSQYGFIEHVIFDNKDMPVSNISYWFTNMANLIDVKTIGINKNSSVVLPESVTEIGDYAFASCNALTGELLIGEDVRRIGDHAFYECKKLTGTLSIPNNVKVIGSACFAYCNGFNGLKLSESLTKIPNAAFSHFGGMPSLTIPDSVTSIENDAFYYTNYGNNITLSKNLKSLSSYVFMYGSAKELILPGSLETYYGDSFHTAQDFEKVIFSEGITKIPSDLFRVWYDVTEITIPSTVQTIASDALVRPSGYPRGAFDGRWYDVETKLPYEPSQIPTGKAATYTAIDPALRITYVANNGEFNNGKTTTFVRYIDGALVEGEILIPTYEGFDFDGWYLDAACTDGKEFDLANVTESTTVYAKWVPKQYSIAYNANGGLFDNSIETNIVSYQLRQEAQTKYSHTPNVSDSRVATGNMPDNIEIIDEVRIPNAAKIHLETWVDFSTDEIDVFALFANKSDAYYDNLSNALRTTSGNNTSSGWRGGSGGTFKQDSITIFFKTDTINNQSKGYHTTITGIAKIPEDVYGGYAEPTRDGYVFAGWYTDEDCTAGNEFDMITYLPNRTVYAKWLPNT